MMGRKIILIAILSLLPPMAFGQPLDVFPRVIRLETREVEIDVATSTLDFLNIKIDTTLLGGTRWQLWLQVTVPPAYLSERFRPEALYWTARPPFISGSLLPNQKVLVGEGPVDGRVFQGRLVWRASEDADTAGEYRGSLLLILEEVP